MSYGRSPYYIYQGEYDDGDTYFCFMDGAVTESHGDQTWHSIKYDAMAQFVASMWRRDHDVEQLADLHGELAELIERGLEVRPVLRDPGAFDTKPIKPTNTASVSESEVVLP